MCGGGGGEGVSVSKQCNNGNKNGTADAMSSLLSPDVFVLVCRQSHESRGGGNGDPKVMPRCCTQ